MKRGMTLIEITVALALLILLMVTTTAVLQSMQQRKKVFADRLDVPPWQRELAQVLRDDLLRSRDMRIGSRTLELLGGCGHDLLTGEPTHAPVHVKWLLKREDDYDILVRIETPHGGLEEFLTAPPLSELMAVGATGISIGAFTGLDSIEQDEMHTLTATGRISEEPGDWIATPKVIKLVVQGHTVRGQRNTIWVNELIYR
jgi:hypothetical protein